jgi:hypothetical protein
MNCHPACGGQTGGAFSDPPARRDGARTRDWQRKMRAQDATGQVDRLAYADRIRCIPVVSMSSTSGPHKAALTS